MRRLTAFFALFMLFVIPGRPAPADDGGGFSCSNCNEQVTAGKSHSCALLRDGRVTCWGSPTYDQVTPTELNDGWYWVQISAGEYHSCGIFDCRPGAVCAVGTVRCWGRNVEGQTSYPINTTYSQVSAGKWHTCAVETDGTIDCWGDNGSGQSTPIHESNWEYFEVAAGGQHTCALFTCTPGLGTPCPDQNVECWGRDDQNQANHPVNLMYTSITAGLFHSCAIRDTGVVDCWGSDSYGQRTSPAGTYSKVSAGGYHTCAVRLDGTIACWGDDSYGQASPPDGEFVDVAAGEYHTCAVRKDGLVSCWGEDDNGRSWPTAGMCGLFRSDFETASDCRWSNGNTIPWIADCDGDGYASPYSELDCGSIMITFPRECPTGSWTHEPPTGVAFDCSDVNADVFSGQTSFFSSGYGETGGVGVRYDYNCDGVEEKELVTMWTPGGTLCCHWNEALGVCEAEIDKWCNEPGWLGIDLPAIPDCGETAEFVGCAGQSQLTCPNPITYDRTQRCR